MKRKTCKRNNGIFTRENEKKLFFSKHSGNKESFQWGMKCLWMNGLNCCCFAYTQHTTHKLVNRSAIFICVCAVQVHAFLSSLTKQQMQNEGIGTKMEHIFVESQNRPKCSAIKNCQWLFAVITNVTSSTDRRWRLGLILKYSRFGR